MLIVVYQATPYRQAQRIAIAAPVVIHCVVIPGINQFGEGFEGGYQLLLSDFSLHPFVLPL